MTVREAVAEVVKAIEPLYNQTEATAIAREVVCRLAGYNFSEFVLHYHQPFDSKEFSSAVEQLSKGCPVQYVTGVARFCDMDFEVCPEVLIPRPETEELVAKVVAELSVAERVLDVGTGSGAIAISVAKGAEGAAVVGVDISEQALQIAAHNAQRLGVEVEFCKADALTDMGFLGSFDVIVSNPPYIPYSDLESMHTNVVDFEPHLALFVADNDPLCFYRSIAQNGLSMLKTGGRLYFEIYEHYGTHIKTMLEQMGYSDVVVAKDIFGKERMVWSRR